MKILPFLILLSISCTKELKFSKEQLLKRAQQADPTVAYLLPRNMNEGINCSDYTEGCLSGHTVKVRGLEMIAVEFIDEQSARRAATKYKGFYGRNWLFDDVRGEPLLEEFVVKYLEAKEP